MMVDPHRPDEQGFIPGLGNYCDRRCERCLFHRQCRIGAMDLDELGYSGEVASEKPEDLRDRLIRMLGLDPEMLEWHDDEECELDMDPEEEEGLARKRSELDRVVEAHSLSGLTRDYITLVDSWMDPREEALKRRGVVLHERMGLDVEVALRTPENLLLSEAFQEMLWFQHMIHVKCERALSGKYGDHEWMKDLDMDPLQSDWNGTARLSLEFTARSLDAWEQIVLAMPHETDAIQPMQELLRRVQQELHKEFPDASKFIRPGFDRPV